MVDKEGARKSSRMKVTIVEDEAKDDNESVEPKKSSEETSPVQKDKEEINEQKPLESEEAKEKPNTNKIPFWILFTAFLLGLSLGAGLIGGVFYYRSKVEKAPVNDNNPLPSSKIPTDNTPQSSATPLPEDMKIEIEKYSIKILNGSGIKGEAAKVEVLLNTAGFSNIKTGNANSYEYGDTEVAIKTSLPDNVYTLVSGALKVYKLTRVDDLSSDNSYDITITVGKNKTN